jgi:hypothetical protein
MCLFRSFGGHGNNPLKLWGQSTGGSGGLTSKVLGESGVQTYFEASVSSRPLEDHVVDTIFIFKICTRLNEGFTHHWDDVHKASIAYKDGSWIGYDDEETIEEKV